MPQHLFLNLPVADVERATTFYEAIGAHRNGAFSDDTTSCMELTDTISIMLLTHDRFRGFAPRPIADAHATTGMLIALSVEARDDVDDMVAEAADAGGRADPTPPQDHGFMCSRSFEDPDGHVWEVLWMDPDAAGAQDGDGDAPTPD